MSMAGAAMTKATSQPPTDWGAVAVTIFAGAVAAISLGKVPAALALIRGELHLNLVEGGSVASAFNTMAALVSVFFGLLLGRWSALQVTTAGLWLIFAGSAAGMASNQLSALLASRVVEGMGFLAVSVAAPALITTVTAEQDRRLALSLWAAYLPLGAGAGMLLAPLVARLAGWRGAWAAFALLALAAFALLLLCRRRFGDPGQPQRPAVASASWAGLLRKVLRLPVVWLYGAAFLMYAVMLWATFVWLPTVLAERHDLKPGAVALLSALAVLVNIPGNLAGAGLLQRGVARDPLVRSALVAMGLAGIGAFWPGLSGDVRYLLCVLLSLVGGVLPPAVLSSSSVLAHSPVQVAVLQGYFVQAANLGQLAGPLVLASLVSWSGDWGVARWIFLACIALASVTRPVAPKVHG